MRIVSTPPTRAAGAADFLSDKQQSEFQTLDRQIDSWSGRLERNRRLLEAERGDRLAGCSSELYDACWKTTTEKHKPYFMAACLGTMFAGAAGGAWATLAGAPQLAGAIALGGLVGCFYATPRFYAGAVKKFVLPGQMDKLVVPALEQESARLTASVAAAKERRQSMLDQALSGSQPPNLSLEVDEAYVIINGQSIEVLD
ncbi:MAG: hypothetical protein AB7S38_35625 [Vulcanimicrobiota bacterium]